MLTKEQKEKYMHLAFEQAKKAEEQGEVPIGAVVVDKDGNVIGEGYNRRELDEDATQHAEMIAIRQACKKLNSWRLFDCSLFITLEPCPMCSGAIINSRLAEVYYGAFDPKAGAARRARAYRRLRTRGMRAFAARLVLAHARFPRPQAPRPRFAWVIPLIKTAFLRSSYGKSHRFKKDRVDPYFANRNCRLEIDIYFVCDRALEPDAIIRKNCILHSWKVVKSDPAEPIRCGETM